MAAYCLRIFCPATLAAAFTAVAQLPWSSWRGAPLSLLLFFPVTAICAVLVSFALRKASFSVRPQAIVPQAVIWFISIMMFLAGAYAANAAFLDPPLGCYTLIGYAGSAITAVALGVAATRFIANTPFEARLRKVDVLTVGATCAFSIGLVTSVVDSTVLVRGYEAVHVALAAITMGFFSTSTSLFWLREMRTQARPRFFAKSTAILISVAFFVAAAQGVTYMSLQVVRSPTAGRRALQIARGWLDRDGDGYSTYLAGGDCDDNDVRAFPLSTIGRDCAGILDAEKSLAASTKSPPRELTDQNPPKVIVLLTIDAFRCGFGVSERPELRDICPNLTSIAKEGLSRFDAHAAYPSTQGSIAALHTTSKDQNLNQSLPQALSELGFRTSAVSTFQAVVSSSVQGSYTEFDDSLVQQAKVPTESTSDALTNKLQALVQNALASKARQFFWGHYFDPHATYVKIPGSHVAYDRIESYIAEVRRTDAAIGRLLQTIRNKAVGSEVVVLVTSDHGEEFGEHGGEQHAATLFEESTRIPFLVWRSGAVHSANLSKQLPIGHTEMGPFILSVARGQDFSSTGVAVMTVASLQDRQLGVYNDGWKFVYHQTLAYPELFNLQADPGERTDLSEIHPAKLASMKRLLARHQPVMGSL